MKKNSRFQMVILACTLGSMVLVACFMYGHFGYRLSEKYFELLPKDTPFEFETTNFGWPYLVQKVTERTGTSFRLAQPEVKLLPPGTSIIALLKSFTKRSAEISYVKRRQQKNAIVMLIFSTFAGLYCFFRMNHRFHRDGISTKKSIDRGLLTMELLGCAALFVVMFRFHSIDWKYPLLFLITFGAYSTIMVVILSFWCFITRLSCMIEKI